MNFHPISLELDYFETNCRYILIIELDRGVRGLRFWLCQLFDPSAIVHVHVQQATVFPFGAQISIYVFQDEITTIGIKHCFVKERETKVCSKRSSKCHKFNVP